MFVCTGPPPRCQPVNLVFSRQSGASAVCVATAIIPILPQTLSRHARAAEAACETTLGSALTQPAGWWDGGGGGCSAPRWRLLCTAAACM